MILNSTDVKELIRTNQLIIDPFIDEFQGPNCYYCHLGNRFYIPKKINKIIDIENISDFSECFELHENAESIILNPNEFILTETFEFLGVNKNHIIRFFNPTTTARWGIYHAGLGFVNAGCGYPSPMKPTLELINLGKNPLKLTCSSIQNGKVIFGTEILKIYVTPLSEGASQSYTGVYGSDQGVTLPKKNSRKLENPYILPKNSFHLLHERESKK